MDIQTCYVINATRVHQAENNTTQKPQSINQSINHVADVRAKVHQHILHQQQLYTQHISSTYFISNSCAHNTWFNICYRSTWHSQIGGNLHVTDAKAKLSLRVGGGGRGEGGEWLVLAGTEILRSQQVRGGPRGWLLHLDRQWWQLFSCFINCGGAKSQDSVHEQQLSKRKRRIRHMISAYQPNALLLGQNCSQGSKWVSKHGA